MTTHSMSLQKRYFDLIRDRKKTIELRLWDEKKSVIKPNDEILFASEGEEVRVRVVDLVRADNFQKLCERIDVGQAGFGSSKELLSVIQVFYTPEQQERYGVVGIRIERIDS
ncbi:MAG: ASCH domain-containing protein [Alphaproteobacteria bacterium]|nr:ASCH domain-containing protein [Alphaproteobacteria bacterium]